MWCKNDPIGHPESDKKIRLRLPVLLGIWLRNSASISACETTVFEKSSEICCRSFCFHWRREKSNRQIFSGLVSTSLIFRVQCAWESPKHLRIPWICRGTPLDKVEEILNPASCRFTRRSSILSLPNLLRYFRVSLSICLIIVLTCRYKSEPEKCQVCSHCPPTTMVIGNGNGLLFHMTQPISRSTIKAIACSKPTISEH